MNEKQNKTNQKTPEKTKIGDNSGEVMGYKQA